MMLDTSRLRDSQHRRGDEGFTLIELLVVIVILAILAAIVVFAVGGITDKGQSSACDTDLKTIQTAEGAYYGAQKSGPIYGNGAQLKAQGFLTEEPTQLHTVDTVPGGAQYVITHTGNNNCLSDYTSPPPPGP